MIKTLRITSFIAAVLAILLFAVPVIYGVRTDENVEKFVNSATVVEIFKASSGNRSQTPSNQVHPLVQQAQTFAKIIAPPPPPQPVRPTNTGGSRPAEPPAPPKVKPKFKLMVTAVCEQNPDLSTALIDEPGSGTRWVGKSSVVTHLTVHEIKDGVIIVKNSEEQFEIKIEEKGTDAAKKPNLRANTSGRTSSSTGSSSSIVSSRRNTLEIPESAASARGNASRPSSSGSSSNSSSNESVDNLVKQIKLIGDPDTSDESITPEEKRERALKIEKLLSEFNKANISMSDEEIDRINELGQILDKLK